jgi:Cys-rich protein (TIGR01571 family)
MGGASFFSFFLVGICPALADDRDATSQKSSQSINEEYLNHHKHASPALQHEHTESHEDFRTYDLVDSMKNPLSISSTWRHKGRSFYLAHSVQQSGRSIDRSGGRGVQFGGEEDMGEETDDNIPYSRGLPGQAMDDLRNELDQQVGSPGSVLRSFMKNLSKIFMVGTASFFVVFIVAMLYRRCKENPTSPPEDGEAHAPESLDQRRWRFGLCNCLANPTVCCMALCCPAVRWSDTMHMAGLLAFWLALTVCNLLLSMGSASFGLTYLLFVLMATHGRQQIRALFGIPGRTVEGFAEDFCTYSCCWCCAIVQEAQQLEEAYAVGHPVVRLPPVDMEAPPPSTKGGLLIQ